MAVHEVVCAGHDGDAAEPASFVVEWASAGPVREPIVEALMVSSHSIRGLSFRSVGQTPGVANASIITNNIAETIE